MSKNKNRKPTPPPQKTAKPAPISPTSPLPPAPVDEPSEPEVIPAIPTPLTVEVEEEVRARLEQLRQEVIQGRDALLAEVANLDGRERRCREVESAIDQKEKELSRLDGSLRALEGRLQEDRRVISEREAKADAGFAERNRNSLDLLEREHARLRAAIQQLTADVATERQTRMSQLDQALTAEETQRRSALERELEQRRKTGRENLEAELATRKAAMEKEHADRMATLERERQAVRDERERDRAAIREESTRERTAIKTETEKLAKEATRLEGIRQELELRLSLFDQRKPQMEKERDAFISERTQDLEARLGLAQGTIESLRTERQRLEGRLAQVEDQRRLASGRDIEAILQSETYLQSEVDRLKGVLATRPDPGVLDQMRQLTEEQRQWALEREKIVRELNGLKARESQWMLGVSDLEDMRNLKEVAERRRQALLAEVEKLGEEVTRLRSLYESPQEWEARIGVIETPLLKDLRRLPAGQDKSDEVGWLGEIFENCRESGLVFPRRLLYAFHTAIKTAEWSPLTVLAGVSGTGKSELPRLYARYGGLAFLNLAVKPDWDNPQALFGFFNTVDNRFNATSLLRALVQSQRDPREYDDGFSDRLLLVLLDEMNLAHVELYFSDLLSKLEERRGLRDGVVQLEVDLGAGLDKYRLPLGRNVLWAGTMNEDETTKSLSDKVLDRGNLISFPRPRILQRRKTLSLKDERPLLPYDIWCKWKANGSQFTDEEVEPYKKVLEEINSYLEHANRALGHRVWQSVENYIANHPLVRQAQAGQDKDLIRKAMTTAFEDAIVQKVMPKLRGIEAAGEVRKKCLDPIEAMLAQPDTGLNLAEDFRLACKNSAGAFVWHTAHYLERDE